MRKIYIRKNEECSVWMFVYSMAYYRYIVASEKNINLINHLIINELIKLIIAHPGVLLLHING